MNQEENAASSSAKMKFMKLGDANGFPEPRTLTPQQEAEVLALYESGFDPVEAEKEYREIIEKGGVSWQDLMHHLDEIDRKIQPRT